MPKKFFVLIYESTEPIPIQSEEPAYRLGPYDSEDEAEDSYFVGCYYHKPDNDETGRPIYWDYGIEAEGKDDVHQCDC